MQLNDNKTIFLQVPNNSFWKKDVAEMFVAAILYYLLDLPTDFRRGKASSDPEKNEPDLVFSDIFFEITFASDRTRQSIISRIQRGIYSSDDIQSDMLNSIRIAIEDKAKKKYCCSEVNLCLICSFPVPTWNADDYGSVFVQFTKQSTDRKKFYEEICAEFLYSSSKKTNRFKSIWLLYPDIYCGWTLQNVETLQKGRIQLNPRKSEGFYFADNSFLRILENAFTMNK